MATTDIYHISGALSPARKSIRFLGGNVDDYIQVDAWAAARTAANDAVGTISAWINMPDKVTTGTVLCAGDKNVVEYIHFSVENGKLFAACVDATTMQWDINSTNVVIKPHTWHHVAIVQDGVRPTMYVDGVAVAMTDTDATDLAEWFVNLDGLDSGRIGAGNIAGDDSVTQEFKGAISDVKYWNAALTAAQVKDDYNGTAVLATNLQSHWKFDDDLIDDGLGADDGTKVGDIVFNNNYSEFTSRFGFLTGTPVVADLVKFSTDKGVGHAIVIQQA